jgi:PHYB activation tagged suppressor 1
MQEAKLILAMLLQKLEWRVADWYQHKPQMMVTLRPAHGLPMMVKARE